jgi:hypothetical protein
MRLTAEWQADYDAWQKRDLSARRYVYVWADGVYAYAIDPSKPCEGFGDNTLWIITEADRSVTTFLFPSEY